jgi:hypothetical protein
VQLEQRASSYIRVPNLLQMFLYITDPAAQHIIPHTGNKELVLSHPNIIAEDVMFTPRVNEHVIVPETQYVMIYV